MAVIETVDKHTVKLTFEADAAAFAGGLRYAYNKNKNNFNIQGFRKGKAPRQIIEKVYGANVFYDEAVNFVLPDAYEKALRECKIRPVVKPTVDVASVSEQGVTFTANLTVAGEASVDEYYALTYKKYDAEPSDAEIQKRIDADRDKNARIVTVVRPVKYGDIVTVDYIGYIDDAPFEGGSAEGVQLTIGARQFIDNFEEQLIGAETGENIYVRVTFPDNYENAALAGKPAVFDVSVKEIQEKELPAMDDDFAQDISDFDTFDEYREDIITKLREARERDAKNVKEDEVMSELVSRTTADPPLIMIENRMDEMIESFEAQLRTYQRITLDDYLQYAGQTKEQLRESYREAAVRNIKQGLALEEIAKKENLTVSEEEINAEIDRLALIYRWDDKQKAKMDPYLAERDLAVRKAFDFVMDHAIEIA